jgi:hypothetical protein
MNKKYTPKWWLYRFRHRKDWGGCCDTHWHHETFRYEDDPPGVLRCWVCHVSGLRKKGVL